MDDNHLIATVQDKEFICSVYNLAGKTIKNDGVQIEESFSMMKSGSLTYYGNLRYFCQTPQGNDVEIWCSPADDNLDTITINEIHII